MVGTSGQNDPAFSGLFQPGQDLFSLLFHIAPCGSQLLPCLFRRRLRLGLGNLKFLFKDLGQLL